MSRRPVIWAYLGNRAGPVQELARDAIEHPEKYFMFAGDTDRARFRRIIEDRLRKGLSDIELLKIAAQMEII